MSERERWRKVRRAPGHKVSSLGRVRSLDRTLPNGAAMGGQLLTPFDAGGYPHVTINGEQVPVHHLVLEAFHGPRPYGMEGCHGPGGPWDNRASVLRWDTHRANERDKRSFSAEAGRPRLRGVGGDEWTEEIEIGRGCRQNWAVSPVSGDLR
jgi:hypothetical protein